MGIITRSGRCHKTVTSRNGSAGNHHLLWNHSSPEANPHSELRGHKDHMKSLAMSMLVCSRPLGYGKSPSIQFDMRCEQTQSALLPPSNRQSPSLISRSWQLRHLRVTGPVETLHTGRSEKAHPNQEEISGSWGLSALSLFSSPLGVTSLFQRPVYFWASQTPLLHCMTPEPAWLDFQRRTVYLRPATGLHQIFETCYVLRGCYIGKSSHICPMGGKVA